MARQSRTGLNLPLPLARTLPLRATGLGRRNGVLAPPSGAGVPDELLDAAVDWGLYQDGMRQPLDDFDVAVARARAGEGFIWIGLHEPTHGQLTQLGEVFGLHALALEDASNPRQRPKLERRDETIFLAMRTLAYVEREARRVGEDEGGDIVETGAVMVFLGTYFVATIRHGRHASMAGMRRRLESNPAQIALGPSSVLHAIADKVVDDYLAVTDAAGEDIEEIESRVFAPRAGHEIERIYQLKRDVIEMKRTVDPMAAPLHELSDAEAYNELLHPEIREYFRDVEDHHARVREQVASFDEVLTSILQAALARLSIAENEDMRKISAWVAIAAVPTMIAGIYGMNFQHMPELSESWGYPAVLALMAIICGALYRGFKRNRWL